MAKIIIPLPDTDFDPSETGAPWKVLTQAGHEVVFATESGRPGAADARVLEGVLFGQLGPEDDAQAAYDAMVKAPAFRSPQKWADLDGEDFDALFLPGGHAAGMVPYLENAALQTLVSGFFDADKPVAAICHGVIVVARSRDDSGRSVLDGRVTTCLPKYMERAAFFLTAWRLGRYYRTYPAYVEDEVKDALGPTGTFHRGPIHLFAKGSEQDDTDTFCVRDGNYVSARWPGDAWRIAKALDAML